MAVASPRFRLGSRPWRPTAAAEAAMEMATTAAAEEAADDGDGDNGDVGGSGRRRGFQADVHAHEGNEEGIRQLLDANFRDSDGRTAMHISACEGHAEVFELLLDRGTGAVEDQWGSTPLADAMHYQNHDVIKILEKHGSKNK